MSRITISINQETSIDRTKETDLEIGVVLESPRGPVLTPTLVSNESELNLLFGESSARYPVLALIRSFLKQYTNVYICRIKYDEMVQSSTKITTATSDKFIIAKGNSCSDYENGHVLTIAKDAENTGKLKATVVDTNNATRTNIINLPTDARDFIAEFNSKSINYTLSLDTTNIDAGSVVRLFD